MRERSRGFRSTGRARRPIATLGATLLVASLGVRPGASAEPTERFLTLPFASTANVHVQRAWWAQNRSVFHHAIDYIRGTLDVPDTWGPFEVLAAAPGDACAQVAGSHGCIDIPDERLTNRVLIRHEVDGAVYFTVYADLATIASGIPVGSTGETVHLERGAAVGIVGEDPGLIHLHFEVLDADRQPVDPYGIEGHRSAYPDPSTSGPITAPPGSLWSDYPPRPAAGEVVPQPSASASTEASAPPVVPSAVPSASVPPPAPDAPAGTSADGRAEPGPESASQIQRLGIALAVALGVAILLRALRGPPRR